MAPSISHESPAVQNLCFILVKSHFITRVFESAIYRCALCSSGCLCCDNSCRFPAPRPALFAVRACVRFGAGTRSTPPSARTPRPGWADRGPVEPASQPLHVGPPAANTGRVDAIGRPRCCP